MTTNAEQKQVLTNKQPQKSQPKIHHKPQPSARQKFFVKLNAFFKPIDDKIGPSQIDYKPGCQEDKQMFLECVLNSPCYQRTKLFKYCAQDGVQKQCKAIRYDYYLCKRSLVFWNKSFSQEDPRKA